MSDSEKKIPQTAVKIGFSLLKHFATTAIGSDAVDEIAKVAIDFAGEEAGDKITTWLNRPEMEENIAGSPASCGDLHAARFPTIVIRA